MAKFDTQMDSVNAICPYCEASYQVESEDYSEDSRAEECGNCGKKYLIYQSFSVDTITKPNCEINGDEHDFELVELTGGGAYFCTVCDECKLAD